MTSINRRLFLAWSATMALDLALRLERQYESLTAKQERTVIPTGFPDLDKMIGGFRPSDFIVIGSRPAMGGDSLALNIAVNAASQPRGGAIALFNWMTRRRSYIRLLSVLGEFDIIHLTHAGLNDVEWRPIKRTAAQLAGFSIFFDGAPIQLVDVLESIRLHHHPNDTEKEHCSCGERMFPLSISDIGNMLRRLQKDHGLDLVIMDDLQLVRHGNQARNRQHSLADIARALKSLAVELQIPIIAVSRLKTEVEFRHDRRPQLGDLLWSDGTVEQVADMVLMVYRNGLDELDFSGPLWARTDETAEILIAKHPDDVTGKVSLPFYGPYGKFGKCHLTLSV